MFEEGYDPIYRERSIENITKNRHVTNQKRSRPKKEYPTIQREGDLIYRILLSKGSEESKMT